MSRFPHNRDHKGHQHHFTNKDRGNSSSTTICILAEGYVRKHGPWWVSGVLICLRLSPVKRLSKLHVHYATNRDQVGFCRQVSTYSSCHSHGNLALLCIDKAVTVQTYLHTFFFSSDFSVFICLSGWNPGCKDSQTRQVEVRLPMFIVNPQTLALVCPPASRDEDLKKANPSTAQRRTPPTVTVFHHWVGAVSCSESTSHGSVKNAKPKAGYLPCVCEERKTQSWLPPMRLWRTQNPRLATSHASVKNAKPKAGYLPCVCEERKTQGWLPPMRLWRTQNPRLATSHASVKNAKPKAGFASLSSRWHPPCFCCLQTR